MINEAELYPIIKNYFESQGIQILQNDVNFFYQLKTPDLLAVDSTRYYVIEVKKDNVTKEDYYNLKYIIENNKLDREVLGRLIGNCKDIELQETIRKYGYIKLISIQEILKVEFLKSNIIIRNHKEYYDTYNKYYRYLFKCISDETLSELSIINNDRIRIIYNISETKFICFKGVIDRGKSVEGDFYVYTYEKYFCDKVPIDIIKDINIKDLRKELYKIKYDNIFDKYRMEDFGDKVSFYNTSKVLNILSNLVDLKKVELSNSVITIFVEINNSDLALFKTKDNKILLCDKKFMNFVLKDKTDDDYKNLKELCNKMRDCNELNFLEFTNLIINKLLIEPIKKFEKYNYLYSKITLELNLKNGSKVSKTYKVKTVKNVKNVDFYLFCNWDIIIHFQRVVSDKVRNIEDIVLIENYINNYNWQKIKREIKGIGTTRNLFQNLIEKYGGIESVFELFNRSFSD
ncbi:hypothetical protein [Clostridium tertium]|jgi:hypothetical protein|uniref:hypothetical protein n=1 Tax=Clostridium tertium TaxID=1559 RepID=UPI001C1DEF41|nr:hypothetical protein [Clostridium tertium]MBU6135195.1 hypothetical protein [Clostridium tertium]